ncbi:AT-hook motif nuclear-localized protein 17-like [Wolffia australiana]
MFLKGPNSDEADSRGAAHGDEEEDDPGPARSAKRPRGRPPGSKNKPKPPPAAAAEELPGPAAAMQAFVLEIAAGEDVVASLARFSRRRNLALSVMAGAGVVSDVALRGPDPLAFPGAFEILSISATFFPQPPAGDTRMLTSTRAAVGSTAVTLAGPRGQIFGGVVAGPLRATVPVTIIAAAFSDYYFHHLPSEDEVSASVSVSSPLTRERKEGEREDGEMDWSALHDLSL